MVATAAAAIVGVIVEVIVAGAVGVAAAATKFFYLVTFLKRIACTDILCGINKLSKVIK